MSKSCKYKADFFGFINDYEAMELSVLVAEGKVKHFKPLKNLIRLHSFSVKFNLHVLRWFCVKIVEYQFKTKSNNLIFDDHQLSLDLLNNCKSKLKNKRVKVVFRNIVRNSEDIYMLKEKEYFNLYSFDKSDCDKYGMEYYQQFCSGYSFLAENREKSSFNKFELYFLGRDKDRLELINNIVDSCGLINNHIKVIKNGSREYVSYDKHLENMISSRIIVDVVQKGQSGMTMRTAEALLAGKKIITNNKSIIYSNYYNEKQIYIFDNMEKGKSELNEFLYSNFNIVPLEYLSDLNPNSFYEKIID
nr:hypothetical protein [Vibrio parahaemolyticus]